MRIEVAVKAGARREEVVDLGSGKYRVAVRERAVEGCANEAVREALAAHFGVAKSRVALVQGPKSKIKRFEIV